MDILAHGLWTNAIFYKNYAVKKRQRFLAVFFGILPDIISFTPTTVYLLFHRTRFDFDTALNSKFWIFSYARESYNYTHSIIIFAAAMLVVAAVRKGKVYWPVWGWALHIFIDIFTHKNFFTTPFLFPLSNYQFTHGTSWGHPLFMIINYGALATVYLIWFFIIRKKHNSNSTNSYPSAAKE